MEHIRLLDCTLRDGGHINKGKFGEITIKSTIERLVEAGIDIIEVGFLWDMQYGTDTSRYYTIADVKRILPPTLGSSKISLMADFIDLNHLEPYDGTVEYIRLSFKRFRLDWALTTAKILMDKGYKVFINPVNSNVYSDKEYIEVLEKVNQLKPYGFAIVDTFGVMRVSDLSHRYFLVENNLNPDITIGLHLHENLGLAYSLGQHFAQIASPKRNIVIDCSLSGMGREPGNLSTEFIVDFLNNQYGKSYATEPIYDAIDDYIIPIKEKHPWGYATPYAMSAKYGLHRTYAEFLMGKQRLKNKDIQRILRQIDKSESELFNEEYVEKLYQAYMNVEYNDTEDKAGLIEELSKYQKILVVAPGKSILESEAELNAFIDNHTCVIAINFVPGNLRCDMIFLTNTKRYNSIKYNRDNKKLIITSNLIRDIEERDYTVSYNEFTYFNEKYCEDSTLILLNLLQKLEIQNIYVAGFDGEYSGKMEYFDDSYARPAKNKYNVDYIQSILYSSFKEMLESRRITFLTPSAYQLKEQNSTPMGRDFNS